MNVLKTVFCWIILILCISSCTSYRDKVKCRTYIYDNSLRFKIVNYSKKNFWICSSSINNQSLFKLEIYDLDTHLINQNNRFVRIDYKNLFKEGAYFFSKSKDSIDIVLDNIDINVNIMELDEGRYYLKLLYSSSIPSIVEDKKLKKFLRGNKIAIINFESDLVIVDKGQLQNITW